MKISVKVMENSKEVPLENAISTGKVIIQNNVIQAQENVTLLLSTKLLDDIGQEIYENDIICDKTGKHFQIFYLNGAFFAISNDSSDYQAKEIIPLYLLQCNGRIPAKICRA